MKHLLVAFSFVSTTAAFAHGEELAGYDRFAVSAAHRPALMSGSVWYPAGTRTYAGFIGKGPVFKGTKALVGAGVKSGRYPVVLFSHGSGGNMDALSWLASELAKQGIMVVGVNHPGSMSGDSSPRRSLQPAERAGDLSAALDHLLSDPYFSRFIDPDRIVAAGFSLGGATALTMAGVTFEPETYADYCGRFGDAAPDCVFFAKGDVDLVSMADGLASSGRDQRVRSAVAIDPGFTYAVNDESLSAVTMPIQLISLGEENLWKAADVGSNGSNLTGKLENVTHVSLSPANHFTFLGECTEQGAAILEEEQDDPICDDPQGTDRADIHKQIVKVIAGFLSELQ
ncbi:MAG: alpha/beta fold hydrolase [Roseibium sp.]|uniref:alpha/beta hydrolase family protein n=1 Tax=Roseibium sp. TaxID=1936156 RepID=UPI00262554A2|nr:alpha/beta fold hydrolase [Roseibium sp.]MCV0429009.1 alpha/beta fold hydrolase [Roseibium sp.]